MKRCLLLLLGLLALVTLALLNAQCAVAPGKPYSRVETGPDKSFPVIGNAFVELTFDPSRGGRCSKFVLKDTGEDIIGEGDYAGMFIDHWNKYPYPSGLMWLPYEYEFVGDGVDRIGIRLWVVISELGGGKGSGTPEVSRKIPTSPNLIGLVVQKTVWLSADNDAVVIEEEIKNPTDVSRGIAPYIQNIARMGGERYHDNWYMPSTGGIGVRVEPDDGLGKAIGPDWVRDPVAGWIGTIERTTGRGMLFVFDYNYIEKIYTCGFTAEWFMDAVPIGKGKSFKFSYVVKPIHNFEDLVHASDNIVADVRPDEKAGMINVAFDLAAVKKELSGVTADFSVIGWKSKEEIAGHSMEIGKVGFEKFRTEFNFTPKDLSDGVVIKATVKGAGFEDKFEYYYAGDKAEYERRYNPFATKGMALAGSRGSEYFRPQPRKHKALERPDFEKIARPAPDKFRVLVVFGLYTDILNIDDALEGWTAGPNAPEFTWANCPPNAIETFPGTHDELFLFNTVVLSDVNYRAIGEIGFEMICDYVEQGGSLLVAGGPYAFGNGEFQDTRFLEILPATLSGPFDLKWAGEGKSWPLSAADAAHPVASGVSFAQDPRVFWHHFVQPKPGAEVVLSAGDQPTLILGRYGKGKVAVLTLSPTGEATGTETPWWNWDGWFTLMKNIFTWLNE